MDECGARIERGIVLDATEAGYRVVSLTRAGIVTPMIPALDGRSYEKDALVTFFLFDDGRGGIIAPDGGNSAAEMLDAFGGVSRDDERRGYTGLQTIPANGYVDIPVTFSTPLDTDGTPVVHVTLRANGTTVALWAQTQYAVNNITNSGFTIRFWNNYAQSFTVDFAYTAKKP